MKLDNSFLFEVVTIRWDANTKNVRNIASIVNLNESDFHEFIDPFNGETKPLDHHTLMIVAV